jgi:hypothetical protein
MDENDWDKNKFKKGMVLFTSKLRHNCDGNCELFEAYFITQGIRELDPLPPLRDWMHYWNIFCFI